MVSALLLAAPAPAAPQSLPVGSPLESYLRVLQLTGRAAPGSFTVRPFASGAAFGSAATQEHPWVARAAELSAVPDSSVAGPTGAGDEAGAFLLHGPRARLRAFLNTGYPAGQNDGAVWQGKGVTSALDVELAARWRGLSVTVAPTFLYAQNADFELAPVGFPGMSEYAYPWRPIDLPQRFGPDPVWRVDPGQSDVRLTVRGAAVGFGTRNLWWGPGIRNAIAMSNHAPGFPHAYLGTARPVEIGIGTLEARWIWGRLARSDWFESATTGRKRFLTGLVVAYGPDFLPGLTLGGTRVFYGIVPEDGIAFGDYFAVIGGIRKKALVTPANPTGDDEHDQLLSLFTRWVLPESGFEVYAEWARNDHAWDLTELLLEPEHSQGYTLGIQKVIEGSGGRLLALRTELTRLEEGNTSRVRPTPTYYAHHIVTEGYTHRGQIIGASVGPGGNAQYLGADLYDSWGRAGAFVERRVHDNDAYWVWAADTGRQFCCHHVSLAAGVSALVFVDDFDLGAGFTFNRDLNRYFDGPNISNMTISLSAAWGRRPRVEKPSAPVR